MGATGKRHTGDLGQPGGGGVTVQPDQPVTGFGVKFRQRQQIHLGNGTVFDLDQYQRLIGGAVGGHQGDAAIQMQDIARSPGLGLRHNGKTGPALHLDHRQIASGRRAGQVIDIIQHQIIGDRDRVAFGHPIRHNKALRPENREFLDSAVCVYLGHGDVSLA